MSPVTVATHSHHHHHHNLHPNSSHYHNSHHHFVPHQSTYNHHSQHVQQHQKAQSQALQSQSQPSQPTVQQQQQQQQQQQSQIQQPTQNYSHNSCYSYGQNNNCHRSNSVGHVQPLFVYNQNNHLSSYGKHCVSKRCNMNNTHNSLLNKNNTINNCNSNAHNTPNSTNHSSKAYPYYCGQSQVPSQSQQSQSQQALSSATSQHAKANIHQPLLMEPYTAKNNPKMNNSVSASTLSLPLKANHLSNNSFELTTTPVGGTLSLIASGFANATHATHPQSTPHSVSSSHHSQNNFQHPALLASQQQLSHSNPGAPTSSPVQHDQTTPPTIQLHRFGLSAITSGSSICSVASYPGTNHIHGFYHPNPLTVTEALNQVPPTVLSPLDTYVCCCYMPRCFIIQKVKPGTTIACSLENERTMKNNSQEIISNSSNEKDSLQTVKCAKTYSVDKKIDIPNGDDSEKNRKSFQSETPPPGLIQISNTELGDNKIETIHKNNHLDENQKDATNHYAEIDPNTDENDQNNQNNRNDENDKTDEINNKKNEHEKESWIELLKEDEQKNDKPIELIESKASIDNATDKEENETIKIKKNECFKKFYEPLDEMFMPMFVRNKSPTCGSLKNTKLKNDNDCESMANSYVLSTSVSTSSLSHPSTPDESDDESVNNKKHVYSKSSADNQSEKATFESNNTEIIASNSLRSETKSNISENNDTICSSGVTLADASSSTRATITTTKDKSIETTRTVKADIPIGYHECQVQPPLKLNDSSCSVAGKTLDGHVSALIKPDITVRQTTLHSNIYTSAPASVSAAPISASTLPISVTNTAVTVSNNKNSNRTSSSTSTDNEEEDCLSLVIVTSNSCCAYSRGSISETDYKQHSTPSVFIEKHKHSSSTSTDSASKRELKTESNKELNNESTFLNNYSSKCSNSNITKELDPTNKEGQDIIRTDSVLSDNTVKNLFSVKMAAMEVSKQESSTKENGVVESMNSMTIQQNESENNALVQNTEVSSTKHSQVLRNVRGLPEDELRADLRRQLEYYFSVCNLAKDRYLISQMDDEQFVQISIVAGFNEIRRLTHDYDLVVEVLRSTPEVIVDDAGQKVKPNHKRCVVILRDVPEPIGEESIKKMFEMNSCPVKLVKCEFASNNSWYLFFADDEDAKKAISFMKEKLIYYPDTKIPIMARIKAKPIVQQFRTMEYVPASSASLSNAAVATGTNATLMRPIAPSPAGSVISNSSATISPVSQYSNAVSSGPPPVSVAATSAVHVQEYLQDGNPAVVAVATQNGAPAYGINQIYSHYQANSANRIYQMYSPQMLSVSPSQNGCYDLTSVFVANSLTPHTAYPGLVSSISTSSSAPIVAVAPGGGAASNSVSSSTTLGQPYQYIPMVSVAGTGVPVVGSVVATAAAAATSAGRYNAQNIHHAGVHSPVYVTPNYNNYSKNYRNSNSNSNNVHGSQNGKRSSKYNPNWHSSNSHHLQQNIAQPQQHNHSGGATFHYNAQYLPSPAVQVEASIQQVQASPTVSAQDQKQQQHKTRSVNNSVQHQQNQHHQLQQIQSQQSQQQTPQTQTQPQHQHQQHQHQQQTQQHQHQQQTQQHQHQQQTQQHQHQQQTQQHQHQQQTQQHQQQTQQHQQQTQQHQQHQQQTQQTQQTQQHQQQQQTSQSQQQSIKSGQKQDLLKNDNGSRIGGRIGRSYTTTGSESRPNRSSSNTYRTNNGRYSSNGFPSSTDGGENRSFHYNERSSSLKYSKSPVNFHGKDTISGSGGSTHHYSHHQSSHHHSASERNSRSNSSASALPTDFVLAATAFPPLPGPAVGGLKNEESNGASLQNGCDSSEKKVSTRPASSASQHSAGENTKPSTCDIAHSNKDSSKDISTSSNSVSIDNKNENIDKESLSNGNLPDLSGDDGLNSSLKENGDLSATQSIDAQNGGSMTYAQKLKAAKLAKQQQSATTNGDHSPEVPLS